jgi:hypothetical protein
VARHTVVQYDRELDLDRESFRGEIKGGKTAVVAVLPPLEAK